MAKNTKDLSTIYNNIIKNSDKVVVSISKNVAQKAQKDIYNQAHKNLQVYYKNYVPVLYDRTDTLKNAIRPYYRDNSTSSKINIEVGVVYDSSYLTGYYSNSKYHKTGDKWVSRFDENFNWDGDSNGAPDPEWILANFLNGIHPRVGADYMWNPVEDPRSQRELMQEFLKQEKSKLGDYISQALLREFTKRVK